MLRLPLVFLAYCALVNAGSANKGDNCTQGHSRLQTGTFQFFDDCNSVTYCASNGTCLLKGCRKDDFPFGYATGAHLPDKCDPGSFCPDEADECQPVLAVGSQCQLNRDGRPCPGFFLLRLISLVQINARHLPISKNSQTPPTAGSTTTVLCVSTTSACMYHFRPLTSALNQPTLQVGQPNRREHLCGRKHGLHRIRRRRGVY